jgi:hypothetical protein
MTLRQANYHSHFFSCPTPSLASGHSNTTFSFPTLKSHERAKILLRAAPCAVPKQHRDLFHLFSVTGA